MKLLGELAHKRARALDAPPPARSTERPDLRLLDVETCDRFDPEADQASWLADALDGVITEREFVRPSEWAEANRYLPSQLTSMPGHFRFSVTPYLREILDCLSLDSPIREVAFMKGGQIGGTVGLVENFIGYCIAHVRTAPVMFVTADADLAKLRLESYIVPMLQQSGLEHLIESVDDASARKSGRTAKKVEWSGGGFLIPVGAKSANRMISISVMMLLRDEIDSWLDVVGRDGDPIKLTADRTAAYEGRRKILDLSVPKIRGASKIEERFKRGDQRYYFVRCLKCNHAQTLRWKRENPETGEVTGIVWQMEAGRLVPDSVRYLCEKCGHPHRNEDKERLLSPDHGAEWRATAVPVSPEVRSYHLSSLYSPPGMRSWQSTVMAWLDAWDVETDRPKDLGKLQAFYNSDLGASYELRGQRVTKQAVYSHRRDVYSYGQIPNRWAVEHCGGFVLVVIATVDVHKDGLFVAVWGVCRGRRFLLLDYLKLKGNPEQPDDKATWGKLSALVEEKEYAADDGKKYPIAITLIDSGYLTTQVYAFAFLYEHSVYPIKGRGFSAQNATLKEFHEFKTHHGQQAFTLNVDLYKERWSAALRRSWDGQSLMPETHFSAPRNATDDQLQELTREVKREKIEQRTGRRVGFEWYRPSNSRNELWDLLVYADAALDLLAWNICRGQLRMDVVSWVAFWDVLTGRRPFYSETP